MNSTTKPLPLDLLTSLRERTKELNCLYQMEEILTAEEPLDLRMQQVIETIPSGWFRPDACQARVEYLGRSVQSPGYRETGPALDHDIMVQGNVVGRVSVRYSREPEETGDVVFLVEERRLIRTIAQRLGQVLLHESLVEVFSGDEGPAHRGGGGWESVLSMLRVTDHELFSKLCRRMLNHLVTMGCEDAREILADLSDRALPEQNEREHSGVNQPLPRRPAPVWSTMADRILGTARDALNDQQILALFQKWIAESHVSSLLDVLDDRSSSLKEICDAIQRHKGATADLDVLSPSTINAVRVALIRRFFSRRLEFINLAKTLVDLEDFATLTRRIVFPSKSHGHIGGKGAGLFLAQQILRKAASADPELGDIRIPKTWYVASDGVLDFMHQNHLEELLEFKYRDLDQIRIEYPNLVVVFKNSEFSPEMTRGLSSALDDLGDVPLIVRSSSLLEDSAGAAFSGKHKSLFLANTGPKQQRLEALLDAVAEVYASMFGPDPIQYRSERGLLDYQEEMGILIQEVVGTRIGPYFLPTWSGVAFGRNEFRWSPRIRREDGLIRIVPGLGTRAVDRLGDDYPVMMAPGQPGLRVNSTIDETIRYAPKYVDVINLEEGGVETIRAEDLYREHGTKFPGLSQVFSVHRNGLLVRAGRFDDFERDFAVPTFHGLMEDTSFLAKIRRLLGVLEGRYGAPLDLEFASDGQDLYLVQCRVQSAWSTEGSPLLPKDLDPKRVVFTADRYISDGLIEGISHLVYVDPQGYDSLGSLEELREVGRIVGRLNSLLPKRRFILMGPGRWGSRGDIKLGVSVTYSDICNTAALVEMAFRKGSSLPDLSFGTHFFQDLVEASIRYLPLYPDDPGVVFKRELFQGSQNLLTAFLPGAERFKEVVKVLDLEAGAPGGHLRVVMSGTEGRAVGYLGEIASPPQVPKLSLEVPLSPVVRDEEHWRWRQRMAEEIAGSLNGARFGVVGIYLFGSVKNATAGPCSDIDLLIHVRCSPEQRFALEAWCDGWSLSLGHVNELRTGCKTEGLLDVHLITDADIAAKTSWAMKIGAVSDAARPLRMGTPPSKS